MVGLLWAWAVFLIGSLTWPFFLVFAPHSASHGAPHGAPLGAPEDSVWALALRDMVVLPDQFLTHASLGFGDLPARNAPQDAFLAVLPFPATWAVCVLMVAAASGAAWAGYRLGSTPFSQAAAMTVAVWNPFVVERLLQGQWSLVIAAWLIPLIASARGPLQLLAIWLASLTPTGSLLALATALTTARSRRWSAPVFALLTTLPWLVPALLNPGSGTASEASADVFGPRAEGFVGTLGALLGLGGMWNADAQPPSRSIGFAIFGVLLCGLLALAWRRVPRAFLVLAAIGFAVPLLSWTGALTWSIAHVPGFGLLRDSQKFVALALPAFVSAAGALRPRLATAALACALLQVPDAPLVLTQLEPQPITVPAVDHRGRDVMLYERFYLQVRPDGHPIVDPATKAMNVVESGELLVDGTLTDPPAPRLAKAHEIVSQDLEANPLTPSTAAKDKLAALEIGLVVLPGDPTPTVIDTGAPARRPEPIGLALLFLWLLLPIVPLALAATRRLPRASRRGYQADRSER
ncbi:hypothetical protein KIP68_03170 [Corynebacterium aquatimens]